MHDVNKSYRLSVVIPAHNEEALIGRCLDSLFQSIARVPGNHKIEIIVCLNRCTDRTESIVSGYDVLIVEESAANVAKVRNTGIAASTGDVVVTLDADCFVTENFIIEILSKVATGKYLGGTFLMLADKNNLLTLLLGFIFVFPALIMFKFSGGMFWFHRDALTEFAGFDESYLTGEDFQFWISLRRAAKMRKLKFGMIIAARVYTSTRKLDELGAWFILKNPFCIYHAYKGKNQDFADLYMYKTKRSSQ